MEVILWVLGETEPPQLTSLSGLPKPGHHTKGGIQTCSLGAPQTWTLVALWSQRDNRGKAKRYQGPSS